MMGFILSKMNLLILVTALFGIIVFFTFSLNDFFVVQKANNVADKILSQATAIISSPAYCAQNLVIIPSSLSFLGGRRAFYVLEISSLDLGENNLKSLKFSLLDRKNRTKIIASARLNIYAEEIKLYPLEEESPIVITTPSNPIYVDPQAVTPIDGFVLAKEIFEGKTYVYVVPCSTKATTNNCAANSNDVAAALAQTRVHPDGTPLRAEEVCIHA